MNSYRWSLISHAIYLQTTPGYTGMSTNLFQEGPAVSGCLGRPGGLLSVGIPGNQPRDYPY